MFHVKQNPGKEAAAPLVREAWTQREDYTAPSRRSCTGRPAYGRRTCSSCCTSRCLKKAGAGGKPAGEADLGFNVNV